MGTRQIYLCGAVSAYQETIPKVHTPGYPGTAAQLLQEVTGIVMQEHPDMVVISVLTTTENFQRRQNIH